MFFPETYSPTFSQPSFLCFCFRVQLFVLYLLVLSRPKCRGTQGITKVSRNFVWGLWAKDKRHSKKTRKITALDWPAQLNNNNCKLRLDETRRDRETLTARCTSQRCWAQTPAGLEVGRMKNPDMTVIGGDARRWHVNDLKAANRFVSCLSVFVQGVAKVMGWAHLEPEEGLFAPTAQDGHTFKVLPSTRHSIES